MCSLAGGFFCAPRRPGGGGFCAPAGGNGVVYTVAATPVPGLRPPFPPFRRVIVERVAFLDLRTEVDETSAVVLWRLVWQVEVKSKHRGLFKQHTHTNTTTTTDATHNDNDNDGARRTAGLRSNASSAGTPGALDAPTALVALQGECDRSTVPNAHRDHGRRRDRAERNGQPPLPPAPTYDSVMGVDVVECGTRGRHACRRHGAGPQVLAESPPVHPHALRRRVPLPRERAEYAHSPPRPRDTAHRAEAVLRCLFPGSGGNTALPWRARMRSVYAPHMPNVSLHCPRELRCRASTRHTRRTCHWKRTADVRAGVAKAELRCRAHGRASP